MKLIVGGQAFSGQFVSYVDKVLAAKKYYKDYLNGAIDSAQFYEAMRSDASLAGVPGFHEYNFRHISLMPPDEKLPSEKIIGHLAKNNIISEQDYDNMYAGFDEYRKYIRDNFDHGGFFTSIYPEDERLLYAVSKITQPKKIFVAGSYYGYFAIWAMKFVAENGGAAVLSDVDPEVCELAQKNFENFGYGDNTNICCGDAGKLLQSRTDPIDMLVLDATGRHDDERPEYRGKRIYGAFLRDAARLLSKGSVIVVHNMEPENPDMKMLVDGLKSLNAVGESYETYNGVGVYILT